MEDVSCAGGNREQRVIAPGVGVREVGATLLGQAVCLADRRVEIDREGLTAGSGTRCPGPGEEMPADRVELADVAPAEAPQERAEGGRRLDRVTEDPRRPAGPQGVGVVDAVTAGERRDLLLVS